jgi:hypothetical protein
MRLCKLALVLGVVAILATPALAQRGRGLFGGNLGANPAFLLRVEKVQKDLGMDKEQVEKLQAAQMKVFEDMRDEFAKLAPNSEATDDEKAAVMKKLQEANDKVLKDNLTEKQQKRLKQIQYQQQGIDMLADAGIQKTLKLSDDQKDKIKEIKKDLDKETEELQPKFEPGTKPDFSKIQENQKKIRELRKDAMTSATKQLNADQKKQLKEMQGEALELKPEDFFGGRRGGKPGGGKPQDF